MKPSRISTDAVLILLLCLLLPCRVTAQEVKGVSVASSSAPLAWTSSGSSGAAVFSAGGRHAFFLGTAGNLTTNVPTGFVDVFRRDLVSGTTVLASSRNENGGRGNGSVSAFSVSANGRWVAFSSRASDLVLGDTNQVEDVFLRDMDAGNTLRISQSSDGGPANDESGVPMLSTDGRFLLFESAASNLVAGTDTNRQTDVFLWDRETGVTARISNATNGVAANGPSSAILLSEDGSRVLFRSVATDLVATGDSIPSDLFVWSRSSGAITRIELPGPLPGAWQLPLAAFNPVLSSNGRFLAFRTGVALSSVAEYEGVWWFDLEQGMRTRLSGGLFVRWPIGHSDSSGPVMSKDGQRVAFEAQTDSTTLSRIRIWSPSEGLKEMDELVNPQPPGLMEPASSVSPVLSPDGRWLAFESDSPVTAAGISTGGASRLYLRNLETGETRTPGVGADLEFSLPSPAFHPDGGRLMFQTGLDFPDAGDHNGMEDVFLSPFSFDPIELVSLRNADLALLSGNGASRLEPRALSHDGRFVTYISDADNLVANDANGRWDVFVFDVPNGTNLLVSVGLDGRSSLADSLQPRISDDGRWVAFVSSSTNLIAGDLNAIGSVYVRDLRTGTTVLASARDQSDVKGNRPASNPQISGNGEWVTFESSANNLTTGLSTFTTRLYLRHLPSRRTVAVSGALPPSSMDENFGSFAAVMDTRGSRVAFLSFQDAYLYSVPEGSIRRLSTGLRAATLSVSRDGSRLAMLGSAIGARRAVYWGDLDAGTNRLVAGAVDLAQNRFESVSISGDGRRVVFESNFVAPNSSDTNATTDVFGYDIASGVLSLVSTAAETHRAGNGASGSPILSDDGEVVAFRSAATDLDAGDSNRANDIFVRNLSTGITRLVSRRPGDGAPGNASASRPTLSGSGRTVVFQSSASDQMPGDFNQTTDMFFLTLGLGGNTLPTLTGATNATLPEMVAYTQAMVPVDPDIPAQPLTVTLLSGPAGLVVTNGVLAWTPTEDQGPSTNIVRVSVSDGGAPVFYEFSLVVVDSTVLKLVLRKPSIASGGFRFELDGREGDRVAIQRSPDLRNWETVSIYSIPVILEVPTTIDTASEYFRAVRIE